jgi:hypothetical protein
MSWNLEGSYFESCSGNVPCPCTVSLSLGATNDYCRAALVFQIGDEVDLEVEDVGPFGVETGEPARTIARTTRSSIDAFGSSYEGKSAFSRSEFSWAA